MREHLFKLKEKIADLEITINTTHDSNIRFARLALQAAKDEYNHSLSYLTNLAMTDIHNGSTEEYCIKIQLLLDLAKL